MSQLYSVTIEEIARLCSYIADDKKVAYHLGIDPRRVKRVRVRMPKEEVSEPGEEIAGLEKERYAKEVARIGSTQLERSIKQMFRKWEKEHGFRSGAGKKLLPAGYSPQREAVAA